MLLNQLKRWHREGFDDGVDRLMIYEALMNLLIKAGVDSFQQGVSYGRFSGELS
jgi:hypothetical protein